MRNQLALTVAVVDGQLRPTAAQYQQLAEFLAKRDTIAVRLSKPTILRTLKANSYYWGVLLTEISQHTGHSTEDLHLVFKNMFLARKFVQLGTKEIELRKTTTDLSAAEFQTYLNQIIVFAQTELKLNLEEYSH